MSELGDLLVLLHGARGRISTVRATVRTWQDLHGLREAMARHANRVGFVTYGSAEEPERESVESLVRVWLAPPDGAREERTGQDGEWVGVRRGRLWWRYDARSGATSNEGQPEIGSGIGEEFRWLLDPAPAIGLLDFDEAEPGRCAGRPTLRVRAVPREREDGADVPLIRLGAMGADEIVLDVDAERGALLRIEARFEHRPIAISEILEIAFDETFPPDTFVFTPPSGEDVRPIAVPFEVRRDLTIEQAVALAAFTVWIPARLPTGWETEVVFAVERDRPPMAPCVHLHYRAADGTHALSIAQSPADRPADEEAEGPGGPWRQIDRNHRRMQTREPAASWQPAQVRMELEGTRILIHSTDLGADALADLAAGLVRAPAEPPDLGT